MRIDWLHVRDFKNLRDFTVDLEEHEAMSVLIGENGSGKSNLFEAIVQIFRELDLGERSTFAYEIRYRCRDKAIRVKADPSQTNDEGYAITVDGATTLTWAAFKRQRDALLPAHVFAYYSGPGTRLEKLFQQHLTDFDKLVRNEKVAVGQLRRLFYCLPRHSRFVLLSYFIDSSTDRKFLSEYFGIEAFDSALLVLKKPWWAKKRGPEPADPRFWGARGDVSRFLDAAWQHSLAPMRVTERPHEELVPGERRADDEERHYLYLQDVAHLQTLAKAWKSPKEFFAALDAVDLADLVGDVRVRVRCGADTWMTFSELSEGEQQLLTVVGMLRFTQGEETLFLLDEPDTHLNPRWKLDYLELLEREVGGVKGSSQLILSTHDPLTIAALKRKQVQIFHRDRETRRVRVSEATEDPRGMGVAGVLTQMFGLPRTLDLPTLQKMQRRDELAMLEHRDDAQRDELRTLNDELSQLGLLFEARDPKVAHVLQAVTEWERESRKQFWSLSEPEQRDLATRLVAKMLGAPSPEGALS